MSVDLRMRHSYGGRASGRATGLGPSRPNELELGVGGVELLFLLFCILPKRSRMRMSQVRNLILSLIAVTD